MQRGRKSLTSLSIPAGLPGQIEPPPSDLTTAEPKLWVQICQTKPSNWFQPDNFHLLKQYVRHSMEVDRLAKAIHQASKTGLGDPDGLQHYSRLLHLRTAESNILLRLAHAMRLTQASRMTSPVATTESNSVNAAEKPWSSAA
jgi:hypothetical protein